MLKIGSTLEDTEADSLYEIRDQVIAGVGGQFDSRLATHYAFAIASTQKVQLNTYICDRI